MASNVKTRRWVSHKLDSKVDRALRNLAAAKDVRRIAVMPDVHLAGDVCNGVVVATESLIYPQCVGGDIGCGYLSIELKGAGEDWVSKASLAEIWEGVRRAVPINKHGGRSGFTSSTELSSVGLEKANQREGRLQLGTLGRGNHFVELQTDQQGVISLLIHSGSRSMGQKTSSWHLKNATVDSGSGLKFVDVRSETGMAFLNDIEWARQYAAANRLEMLRAIESKVLFAMGFTLDRTTLIHLDHNHVQQEFHDGRAFWVHRKGAQVLQESQVSVIPGTMGTTTYLVEGRQNAEALYSCSHGAGRAMSRKEAAQRISVKTLCQETNRVCINPSRLRALVDEAPSAYKDIRRVMKAQRDLVRIVGRREPLLNFKGK